MPKACPRCGSVDLAQIGAGTTRVEAELQRHFPRLEVVRLDADVAAQAGEPEATLRRFRGAEAAVLVGTQLVAKGHDVPGVKLAAVDRRRPGARRPGLPRRGACLRAAHAAVGPAGASRRSPWAGDRPGVGPRASTGRTRRAARRARVPRRRARAPRRARLSALPAGGTRAGRGALRRCGRRRSWGRPGRDRARPRRRHPARALRRSFACATGGAATSSSRPSSPSARPPSCAGSCATSPGTSAGRRPQSLSTWIRSRCREPVAFQP